MENTQRDIEYAIREAEILYWTVNDGPSRKQIINCASRLSGMPIQKVEKTYNTLKAVNINS